MELIFRGISFREFVIFKEFRGLNFRELEAQNSRKFNSAKINPFKVIIPFTLFLALHCLYFTRISNFAS